MLYIKHNVSTVHHKKILHNCMICLHTETKYHCIMECLTRILGTDIGAKKKRTRPEGLIYKIGKLMASRSLLVVHNEPFHFLQIPGGWT